MRSGDESSKREAHRAISGRAGGATAWVPVLMNSFSTTKPKWLVYTYRTLDSKTEIPVNKENTMAFEQLGKTATAAAAVGILVFSTMSVMSTRAHADDDEDLSTIGLRIAPVPLHTQGLDTKLVGLGSFIVNAQADCNGCHTSNPATQYLDPGNPYFLFPHNQPPVHNPTGVNPATYLAGGSDFGPVGAGVSGGVKGAGPDIITRNLTPNFAGRPEGGHSFSDFLTIIRTGKDFDHIHLNCSATVTNNCYTATPGNELNGALLQIMPWPVFRPMTDHQLLAVYTYLSAIPCIDNTWSMEPAGAPTELRNTCH